MMMMMMMMMMVMEDGRYVRFFRVVIPGVFLGVLSSILL